MAQILNTTTQRLAAAVGAIAQTVPIKAPLHAELTVVIDALNGIPQGVVVVDATNSSDAQVAAGTAVWQSGLLTYNTSGTFVQKLYSACWVRIRCTSGAALVSLNPVGSVITTSENPFVPIAAGAAVNAAEILAGTNDGVADNSPLWNAAVGANGSLLPLTVRARFAVPGNYAFNSLNDLSPSISVSMDARGGIQAIPGPNLPAVTPGTPGVGTGGGAPAALFRSLRATPVNAATQAFSPMIGGFNINGAGVAQVNAIDGWRIPNPNPANNANDPDPGYTGNKDYVAGFFWNMDINGMSGDGWVGESGNGRASMFNVRALNCQGNGFLFAGNDVCFYGHSGSGGNGQGGAGFGVRTGLGSGYHFAMPNFWGSSNLRSATVGAVWINKSKAWDIIGGEFNDWLRIDSDNNPAFGGAAGSSFWRQGAIIGVCFAPFNDLFSADGVAIDNTPNDTRLQAQIGITGGNSANFIGNSFSRSTSVKSQFATPNNVGGDLVGNYGTAFQNLYDVTAALINVIDTINSAPNTKPWVTLNADPLPYAVHGGGQINYIMMDSFLNQTRIGARGATHSHLMLGVAEAASPNTAYAVELGDGTAPSGVKLRNAVYGLTEFNNIVRYLDSAYVATPIANGDVKVIPAGDFWTSYTVSGGGIAGASVGFTTDQDASYEGIVTFQGGAIGNNTAGGLVFGVVGGGSINTNGLQLPNFSPGTMGFRYIYRHDTNQVYISNLQGGENGSHFSRFDTVVSPAGIAGRVDVQTLLPTSAVALTNNAPLDVKTMVLGPGSYAVFGSFGSTATAATVTQVQAGLSSTLNTLPASHDGAYASVGFAGTAVSGQSTGKVGPSFVKVAQGATATIHLVVQANFGAGTVAGWGEIFSITL